MRWTLVALALLPPSAAGQEKSASPVPFAQILACVTASNCKNMTRGRVQWADMGGSGLVFEDGGWKYGLALSGAKDKPRNLTILLTPPGEKSPAQHLTLDATGQLLSGELRFEPGTKPAYSAEERDARRKARKAFSAVDWGYPGGEPHGDEFKPFWQKQADQALAAIRRTVSK